MLRKTLALASILLTLFLVGGLPTTSYAQTFEFADCNGVLTEDNIWGMTTDVTATKVVSSNPKTPPQISGTVSIGGTTGPLAVSITANVTKVNFSYSTIGGIKYAQAQITTGVAPYENPVTGFQTTAWIYVDMVQYGAYGQLGFKVYDATTGNILAQTSNLNTPGIFKVVPLYTSDMMISF